MNDGSHRTKKQRDASISHDHEALELDNNARTHGTAA